MAARTHIDESQYLDPVMLSFGKEVYSYEYAQMIRKENLELKRKGRRLWNIIPQAGFQEKVSINEADILIVGGARGGGKSAISLILAMRYAENPDVNMVGFRRLEDDAKRGLYAAAKTMFRGVAEFADTDREIKFFKRSGASMKMDHLADLSKVKDRFRGAELPYIIIEELTEFTGENLNVIFDLIGSNRSTAGVKPQIVCTTNPKGPTNKLYHFISWYLDPDTHTAIPARSGKIRYFCRYGKDVMEIAWGNSPEEVYQNPNARAHIAKLTEDPDRHYREYITSLAFIDGDYADNQILHVSDPKYMNRISSGGDASTVNDIRGVWADVDDTDSLLTVDDMQQFFDNVPQMSGMRVAGGDLALKEDWFVLWAMDGWHIIDVEAHRGLSVNRAREVVKAFLERNKVAPENFAFDGDGLGVIFKTDDDDAIKRAVPFGNRVAAKDKVAYSNRKSECAGMLVAAIQDRKISIDESVLRKTFTERKIQFSIREKLLEERLVLKWVENESPRTLIKKKDMKSIINHSPDFIEGLLYAVDRADNARKAQRIRKGNWSYFAK